MLKLPKGLKKKKKGKKSKKNQELFTEEELETYKREQREKHIAEEEEKQRSQEAAAPTNDDEWSKFNALTTGIDTVLKKTQGDLDRIKESSFYQRVPTTSEKKVKQDKQDEQDKQEAHEREEQHIAEERVKQAEAAADSLAQAVIELSESEEESEEADDIFDTGYIDVITSGDVQLAYVPESPTDELDLGPDPFDTSYAEKVIKGPEVSKRGKKLVNIGAAVEVLTGRVEKVTSTSVSRRPRRGITNLLLSSFDDGGVDSTETASDCVTEAPAKTLLDELTDDIPDIPIDLSVSLHIAFQKEKDEQKSAEPEVQTDLSEFDVLKTEEENDEFSELAAESLTKHDEVHVITEFVQQPESEVTTDWAAFEEQTEQTKGKPVRPPPPRPVPITAQIKEPSFDDFEETDDVDPFDTTFVEKVIPIKDEDDDFDFDPRKDENSTNTQLKVILSQQVPIVVAPQPIDLLSDNNAELAHIEPISLRPTDSIDQTQDIDPFDTSAVNFIVQPKAAEISLLEKELLSGNSLKNSLSDPDFDPRAEEEDNKSETKINYDTARRKSSLSLNISGSGSPKTVGFSVHTDLLGVSNTSNGKIQKPLTPYYSEKLIEEKESEDPFDTSFVPVSNPSKVELHLLERDLLQETSIAFKRSLSDPDFDPRAVTPVEPKSSILTVKSDLLAVDEEHNIKVLTPAAHESRSLGIDNYVDPFDTSSIDQNILPGRAELKLIENELLPSSDNKVGITVLDSYSDSQELGLGDRVLTPQVPFSVSASLEESDPFDTSIANNLGPGKTEIKLLESELIHR